MLDKLTFGKYQKLLLSIIVMLSLLCLFFTRHLEFEYSTENFFPVDNPGLQTFLEFREKFENDTDFLLLGIENSPSIFEKEFLIQIDSITRNFNALPWLDYVVSPTSLKYPVISTFGPLEIPVLHFEDQDRYQSDSVRIYGSTEWLESVFSRDGTAVSIFLKHKPGLSSEAADSLLTGVERILKSQNFQQTHIGGLIKGEKVYITKMKRDLRLFFSISVVLVIIFLYAVYRTPWAIAVPILVVVLAIIWLMGIMGIAGKRLEILVILLPSILFVIGMSDIVHILTKFIEEIRKGKNKRVAIRLTVKEIGYATFLTSLTTAVGFMSLYSGNSKPIKEFGLYAALGVFIAYVLAFTLLPATLLKLKDPAKSLRVFRPSVWHGKMLLLFVSVLKHKKGILFCSGIIFLVSLFGIGLIKSNYYLLNELPEGDSLKQDSRFFEQKFGGIRTFEMMIGTVQEQHSVYTLPIIQQLNSIEEFLHNSLGVKGITSLAGSIRTLNRAAGGGFQELYRIPVDSTEYQKLARYMNLLRKRDQQYKLATEDGQWARISGRHGDIGSLEAIRQEKMIKEFFRQEIDSTLIQYHLTNSALLIDRNNLQVPISIFQGLSVALLIIALFAGLLFQSWRLIGITLIANLLPLMMIAAIMGYFGIYLSLSTSIIFTIVFGIAVDDTIHFISKFKVELNKGKSNLYAIKRTFISTGKAIIVTSFIIAGGFSTLIFSSFESSAYTGLLVSLALLFAVLIDLTLLPVLMILLPKRSRLIKSG